MLAWAASHPVLAVLIVWGVNAVVRKGVSVATGYDALEIALDAVRAAGKKQRAEDKARALT